MRNRIIGVLLLIAAAFGLYVFNMNNGAISAYTETVQSEDEVGGDGSVKALNGKADYEESLAALAYEEKKDAVEDTPEPLAYDEEVNVEPVIQDAKVYSVPEYATQPFNHQTHQDAVIEETDVSGYGMGSIPGGIEIDDPDPVVIEEEIQDTKTSELPEKLDPRGEAWVTDVKNQGPYGDCWAFASVAAMESSLIKSGYEENSLDLSELHMIYFMYSENLDSANRISSDRNYVSDDGTTTPTTDFSLMAGAGGNITSVGWQASNWVGPVEDNGDAYTASASDSSYAWDHNACFSSKYHIRSMRMLNFDNDNMDAVKALIYECGGVAANFYCEQTTANGSSAYFQTVDGTRTYYNPNGANYNTTHAIEVVGWDDNYPKENFKEAPPADGAWLVKNSWGSDASQDGFIWLSYYNIGKEANAVAYEFERAHLKDNIYQYDGSDYMSRTYTYPVTGYFISMFTADESDSEKPEVIESVGVGIGANASYEVSILLDPVVKDGKLSYSEERGVTSCTSSYAGYYMQQLSEAVAISSGQSFAVCVKAAANVKMYAAYNRIPTVKGATGSIENQQEGQYYIGSSLNNVKTPEGSFAIKAFTSTSYNEVTGIALNRENIDLDLSDEDAISVTLTAALSPAGAVPTITWSSSDKEIATVVPSGDGSKAVVTAHLEGTCVITAKSYDGKKYASCTVTVENTGETGYIVKTSKSGDLYWSINPSGKLSVWGKGDYGNDVSLGTNSLGTTQYAPAWTEYAAKITEAEISVTGITTLKNMFYKCSSMKNVSFAGSDTSKVTSAFDLFYCCNALESLDFTDFSTESCVDMGAMFYDCDSLTQVDVSGFSTAKAVSMQFMFYYCSKLEKLDLGSFDTSNVQYMNYMFCDSVSLSELDVSGFTFVSGVNVTDWITRCYALKLLKVPASMPSGISLPIKNLCYWENGEGTVCTDVAAGLEASVTYRKRVPVVLDTDSKVSLKNSVLTYGQDLSNLIFDSAVFLEKGTNTVVPGTLSWKTADAVPDTSVTSAEWVFTPDQDEYIPLSGIIGITVNKALPAIAEAPTVAARIYNLSSVLKAEDLTGGTVNVDGVWSWQSDSIVPTVNNSGYVAVFTPTDSANYKQVTKTISVTVSPSEAVPDAPAGERAAAYTAKKVSEVSLDGDWIWQKSDENKELLVGETVDATAVYNGTDAGKGNYVAETVVVSITRQACAHETVSLLNTKKAGCETTGYSGDQVCDICKAIIKEGEELPATGHSWDVWEVTKEASETEPGEYTRICKNDPTHVGTKEIPVLTHEHHLQLKEQVNATCTSNGMLAHYECDSCALWFADALGEQEILDEALYVIQGGHKGGTATCIDRAVCEVCGKAYGELDPDHHTGSTEVRNGRLRTCTVDGYTGDICCMDCNAVLEAGTVIPAVGHIAAASVIENQINATCTEDGSYDEVIYCSVCGEEMDRQTSMLEATGHSFGEWIRLNAGQHQRVCENDSEHKETADHSWDDGLVTLDPTCMSEGIMTFHCTACDATKTEQLEETEHTLVVTAGIPAACETAGRSVYYTCSVCGKYFSDPEGTKEIAKDAWKLDALGHSYEVQGYVWSADNASCTATAVCEHDSTHKITEQAETSGVVTRTATCKEPGVTTYTAEFTNPLFAAQTKDVANIAVLTTHTPSSVTRENEVKASCTQADSYDAVIYCLVCGKELSREKVTGQVLGHDWGDWITAKAATENETGLEMRVCSHDASHKETRVLAKLEKKEESEKGTDTGTGEGTSTEEKTTEGKAEKTTEAATTQAPVSEETVKAGDTVTDNTGAYYVVTESESGNAEVTYTSSGAKAEQSSVTVPDSVIVAGVTYKVTSIAQAAFKNNKTVTAVVIGDCVETIEASAFEGCSELGKVTIPASVTVIGDSAFEGCAALKKVTVPASVTVIGNSAFKSCTGLKSVNIKKAEIGKDAFNGCTKLTNVTIGANVTTIGDNAFAKCSSLKKITIPAKATKIGKAAFGSCRKLKTIVIKTRKLTTKSVGKNAFSGISTKAVIKVPKQKKKEYTKLLRSKGLSKKVRIQ